MEICAKEEWRGGPTQTNCWTRLSKLRDFQRERERAAEQDGWVKMREKEQQCDPTEFMIILLKHMPAMVKLCCVSVHECGQTARFCCFPCIKVCECVCWQGFEVVKGNFSRTFLRVDYHKIADIPAGACNISIKETIKSRNYLGTHTYTHKHTHKPTYCI